MAKIVFRNGKQVKYNDITSLRVENGVIQLFRKEYIIAYAPLEVIERVDCLEPCSIRYPQRKKK